MITDPHPNNRANRLYNVVLLILLLCAASEFIVRGPLRFAHAANFNDFISPYIQTRAWIHGLDPYSPQNLLRLWPADSEHYDFLAHDFAEGTLVYKHGIPTAYPLTAFVLLVPVAALPWPVAHAVWLIITALVFAITVISLMWTAKLLPREKNEWNRRGLVFLTLALALAPFHTGLAAGSIVTIAVAASAVALFAAERDRDLIAGILLAAAVCLKPQIGLPFLFYYLLRRRWRIVGATAGVVVALAAIALVRLVASATPWLPNYLYDNRVLLGPGSLGDFTEKDPLRFGLINSQVAAYTILQNRDLATAAAFAVAAIAGLIWLFLLFRAGRSHHDTLLELSTLAVLSLIPVYHRFYDASLLIFPLAWSLTALTAIDGRLRTMARCVLAIIILVFLVPGGTILEQLQLSGHFAAIQNYWWWKTLVLPHESWSILLVALLLLGAMKTRVSARLTNAAGK
jgi:Glycosyltransferase family 87